MANGFEVGTLLSTRRKEKDLTQLDVATRLGTSRANYSHMETAHRRNTAAILSRACTVLDIDPLEMVQALGFRISLPDGVRDQEEARLLERWRSMDDAMKSFLRAGLGL